MQREYEITENRRNNRKRSSFRLFRLFSFVSYSLLIILLPLGQQEAIRLNTNLVVIDAQVLDRKTGEIINGLKAEDFEVYEDGTKQEITHFSQDKLTLSVILLIDLSSSVSPVLSSIRLGALTSLNRLKETDEVAVMAFSTTTQLVQGFTTDRQTIINKLDGIEKAPLIGQGTLLFQGLKDAALYMNKASNPASRRVIITITDNVSWDYYNSGVTEKELADYILESGSMVCGLIVEGSLSRVEKIFRRGRDGKDIYRRRMTIDPFANSSGGETIKAATPEINSRLAQLIDHLRTRYTLGFSPKREQIDGGYRQLRLILTPQTQNRLGDVLIKSRQGYFARRRTP